MSRSAPGPGRGMRTTPTIVSTTPVAASSFTTRLRMPCQSPTESCSRARDATGSGWAPSRHDVGVKAAKRIWARVSSTMNREPVDWVLVSVALFGFGLLLVLGGSTELVSGMRDQARGVHATARVDSCNDLRLSRCQVTVARPGGGARRVTVEPGRSLEAGSKVRVVILPSGAVEVIDRGFWAWGVGATVLGALLVSIGGWRLLSGREDADKGRPRPN